MHKDITLNLAGGLGNQLFQYAAARSLSLRLSVNLVVDPFRYGATPERECELQKFPVKCKIIQYSTGVNVWDSVFWRARRRLERYTRPSFHFSGHYFNKELWNQKPGTVMSGWFTSYRYFDEYWPAISKELDLTEVSLKQLDLVNRRKLKNSIGVHVRRGDFLNHAGYLMKDSVSYYTRALEAAREKVSSDRVLVFSDDIKWCKEQSVFSNADFWEPDFHNPHNDMFVMSMCNALIIANSTFSWWAAWFASNASRSVFAPHSWTKGMDPLKMSLYPPNWTIVPE